MRKTVNERKRRKGVDIRNLSKIEGIIKVGHTVRWSEQIDEILYGRADDK